MDKQEVGLPCKILGTILEELLVEQTSTNGSENKKTNNDV